MPHHGRRVLSTALVALAAVLLSSTTASASLFSNPQRIAIPGLGTALPYSSPIQVSGMRGPITRVQVVLAGFSHPNPRDVDVLLVSPAGENAIVMSDVCDGPVTNRTWLFNMTAETQMPLFDPCLEFNYRPTAELVVDDEWPGLAGLPGIGFFDSFDGENPNGEWGLYVVDDSNPGLAGEIAGGWSLLIDTSEVAVSVPATGSGGIASPFPVTTTVAGLPEVVTDVD